MARILLYSFGSIGKTMSGPAIRYWEFAKALSKNHDVTLLIPNKVEVESAHFKVVQRAGGFRKYFKDSDVIVTMLVTPSMAWSAKKHGVRIILDAYDPMPFETMEANKDLSFNTRLEKQNTIIDTFNFSFRMADAVICANESQADLWRGMLLSLKKIGTEESGDIPSLNKVQIVPFGLSSIPPKHAGESLKSVFKLKETDKVVLWGGSISNWFDPLSLILAMQIISQKRSDVHLVFMGVQTPDVIQEANVRNMAGEAQKLAHALELTGRTVHFNQKWIPYEQRTGFLLDADIGISTHFDHLETRYSFRTRILDYIWASLPIISTEGDCFARLINTKELGLTVPYKDPQAIAEAVLKVLDNPALAKKFKANLEGIREQFYWENVVQPIEDIVLTLPSKKKSWIDFKEIILSVYREKGLFFPFKVLKRRVKQRMGLVDNV